jgi:hypothetical protein
VKIGVFSTDWIFKPAPDLAKSCEGHVVDHPTRKIASYGGCFYYRCALPYHELAKHGYEVVLSWAAETAPDGRIQVLDALGQTWHDDCDVIVFQRWMGEAGAEMAARARAAGQIIINDIDDHFWTIPDSNFGKQFSDPDKNVGFNVDHYRKMLAASSAITVSTTALANFVSRLGPPVFILRNSIELPRWQQRDPDKPGHVGWVGGVAWRGNDLPILRGVIGPYLEENGLSFYHGGHAPQYKRPSAWDQMGIDTTQVNVFERPMVGIDLYHRLWDEINLAVIPIEDCSFNRAKSWLKGLEASARGIPWVASSLPEYKELGVGRLAKTPQQWRRHLDELLDPEVRRSEGAANRKRAEELAIHNTWHQWADMLDQVTQQAIAA